VEYKSSKEAEQAYDDFSRSYLPALSDTHIVQIEDGTWTACRLEKNLLIIVFNAPVKGKALHLIEAVQKKSR